MSHVLSPSTVKTLKIRQNRQTLRMLCRDLGLPETQATLLSAIMRNVPGCCSLARENEIRKALGLPPRTRKRYHRPCMDDAEYAAWLAWRAAAIPPDAA